MRAQCSICSDLYDGESHIAAIVKCGHTFHDQCLTQWLNQSMTCPQCRDHVTKKGVIHRLFFDHADEEESAQSPSKLQNEVSTLKACLRQKDREKAELNAQTETLREEVKELKQAKSKVDKAYKSEKNSSASLQRELAGFQAQQREALEARHEAEKLRQRLENLTAVQSVVQGLECDVQDMIGSQGDVKQLATWCAVLKKELASKRTECKLVKERFDRINKDNTMRKRDLEEKTRALTNAREQLKHSEEDLKTTERELESARKKMALLQKAIESPTNTASSLAHRLMYESPAPQSLAKKPRLSLPSPRGNGSPEGMDLDVTPDLFPDLDSQTPAKTQIPKKKGFKECTEMSLKLGKGDKTSAGGAKREVSDISNTLPLNMNIFKKKPAGSSGMFKQGYNGLGGHEKFINPFARPSTSIVVKKPSKTSAKMRNMGPAPALPTLDFS